MILRRKSTGAIVTLATKAFAGGGEGRIYQVATDSRLVAKVYHHPTSIHEKKLALMVANPWPGAAAPQAHHPIAWPLDLLIDNKSHRFVGLLMWRVTGMFPIYKFYTPQTRRVVCPKFNYRYLHRVARNITALVDVAHSRHIVMGDINESGLLGGDNALVTGVDADSFQICDPCTGRLYRCEVGKGDFTPAELQGQDLSKVDRSVEHDRFGLAVIVFRLLMEGAHPFDGKFEGIGDPPPLEARISSGHFPHGRKRVPWSPKPVAPPFAILHPTLQQLFIRCFEEGHKNPRLRPDAQTWIRALGEAEVALIVCQKNPQHLFGNHLNACPWCQRTALFGGLDPFPKAGSPPYRPVKRPARKMVARPVTVTTSRHARQLWRIPSALSGQQYVRVQPLFRSLPKPPIGFIILLIAITLFLVFAKK